jgi:hypothetical protein
LGLGVPRQTLLWNIPENGSILSKQETLGIKEKPGLKMSLTNRAVGRGRRWAEIKEYFATISRRLRKIMRKMKTSKFHPQIDSVVCSSSYGKTILFG